jgi:hypothetical protein
MAVDELNKADNRMVRRASSAGLLSCIDESPVVKALNRLHAVRGWNCS